MTYILFFSAIVAGILCKKSKLVSVYILIVMLILSVYKYNCADLNNYRSEYNNMIAGIGSQNRYIGHYWIVRLCTSMSLSFNQYLYIYYCLFLFILVGAISRLTQNVNTVLSCYMIYSFGIDAIQMKTMLADGIALIALVFLFYAKRICIVENRKNNKYFYLFLIFSVFSALVHFINAFFVVVGIFFYIVDYKKYKKNIMVLVAVVFTLLYMNLLPQIIFFVTRYVSSRLQRYITYWMTQKVQWGWLIPTVALCLITIYMEVIGKGVIVNKNKNDVTEYMRIFIYSVWGIMPFFLYNVTFMRVVRVYVILICILLSKCKGIHLRMKRREVSAYLLFVSIMLYLYMYEINTYYDRTLGAILRYNSLFE